jgi:hypothetical protein
MAKSRSQDITQTSTNTFVKGLNKDSDPSFVSEGMWTHARNAVNNTAEGDLGTISNESANYLCATTAENITNGRKVIVGAIHLYSDKWVIYTAVHIPGQIESINSEIGLFEEDLCKYRPIVQDPCLNLNELNLITGASREKEDCSWAAYWSDGLNPDRYLNLGDPQTWPSNEYEWIGNNTYGNLAGDELQWPGVTWNQDCSTINDCVICTDLKTLNCEALRLARLVNTPCLHVETGKAGGTLLNGSYFATIAYAIKGQKVTDWYSPSNIQPLWFESEPQGALEITVEADQENFEEFILVVVAVVNQQTVAKQFGIYSTKTNKIYIDQIKTDLPSIPIEFLPIQTPVFEKSDQIAEVNNYLLRVGPTSRFDFNYQPLANLIKTKWVSVEYDSKYYADGGYKPSYLRDEVYAFFIRWVYNTGDKSSSYHIPGRFEILDYQIPNGPIVSETQDYIDTNTLFTDPSEAERVFEIYNTATYNDPSGVVGTVLEDGGLVVGTGDMAYWESTEIYPDNRPDVWNTTNYCWTGTSDTRYDLCGKPVRHHKFPDQSTHPSVFHFVQDTSSSDEFKIRILGVQFENIIIPKDQDGNDIPGIVGYEILRGSREGNKTIVAKGMINNLRSYNLKGTNIGKRKGLYPNYPFNTIIPVNPSDNSNGPLNVVNNANLFAPTNDVNDPYIIVTDEDKERVNVKLSSIPRNIVTFHSPDTNFRKPFLSTVELKLYGTLSGRSEQYFIEPAQHPKNKLVSDAVVAIAFLAGALQAVISLLGKRTVNSPVGAFEMQWEFALAGGNSVPLPIGPGTPINSASNLAYLTALGTYNAALATYYSSGASIADSFTGGAGLAAIQNTFATSVAALGGSSTASTTTTEVGAIGYLGIPSGIQQALYYFSEGSDLALKVIYALLPFRQYALQMQAHGLYDTFNAQRVDRRRRFKIADSLYLKDSLQDIRPYGTGTNQVQYRINNLKRTSSVVIRTTSGDGANNGPDYILENVRDRSLVTIGTAKGSNLGFGNVDINFDTDEKTNVFNASIISHYAGLKYRIRNQYGQLDSIKQIPITACEQKDLVLTNPQGPYCNTFIKRIQRSEILFNGDTYINRYTEKNNMFFFQDWLYGQPDGYENNYLLKQMLPKPRFWMNSEKYEIGDFIGGLTDPSQWFNPPSSGTGLFPTRFYKLDNTRYDYSDDGVNFPGYPGFLGVKESYFYLACNSVRDFFVESDVIVDFREEGIPINEKYYNPYGFNDLQEMFNMNPETVARDNFYSYDYSLSISKLFTQYFSQGNLQSRYYNPEVAKLCYTYYPDRIIYSLPQDQESAKDSWFIYLANNYKEFKDQISGVKNFAKTGIFITFKNSSPLVFQGVDQLQTDFGTKITIGDGGLFAQAPQSVVISDREYEYGSSQNLRSIISTPAGMYYISQNQGKIMSYIGNLDEISQNGLKWWFTLFLPYKLIEDFPDYPHTDNPVAGIGCQSIYDNRNSILYFTKKDYKLKPEFKGRVIYDATTNDFVIDRIARFKLNDLDNPAFESASWSVSYDPKSKFWISFHDWHPDLLMAGKETFLSTKFNSIWKHNDICDQFCNYYGVNYPFEVEIPVAMGQTVTTVKSMEYILEAYRRVRGNCVDQHHVLDYNFDKAVVYNTEQVSGYLNLNLYPKNNVALSQQYPQVNINSIDILFSKEEQKYRFNQFWDITRNRGEFPLGSNYPPTGPVIPGTTILDGPLAEQNIWVTQANGYIKQLNPTNLDYSKPELQRKRFRHYLNFLFLSKQVSVDTNVILKIVNTKKTYSPR